jgi:large conductance mechanosensitive channel
MRKFFGEFKKFITRGNVVDMAVGVIVGSSFTAIVNGMSNFILKPIINYLLALIFKKDTLTELYTFLGEKVYLESGEIDLANCIYIDWGAFINAVLNFFLVALVLFSIVKIINGIRERHDELVEEFNKGKLTKAERKELKKLGIRLHDVEAVKAYREEKAKAAAEAAEAERLAAEEKARIEREQNPTTEDLLKQIRDLLKEKN